MKRKSTTTSPTFARHEIESVHDVNKVRRRLERPCQSQRLHDMSRLLEWMSWRVRSSDLAFTRVFWYISNHPPAIPNVRVREKSDVWYKFTSRDDLLGSGSRLCWSLTTRQVWLCPSRRILSLDQALDSFSFPRRSQFMSNVFCHVTSARVVTCRPLIGRCMYLILLRIILGNLTPFR